MSPPDRPGVFKAWDWVDSDYDSVLRDRSLITGRGATKQEGEACEVLPLRKEGSEKVLATLKGGIKSFGVVFMR